MPRRLTNVVSAAGAAATLLHATHTTLVREAQLRTRAITNTGRH